MINLEIKVFAKNLEEIKNKAIEIGAEKVGILHQVDTYFLVGERRIKLREEKDTSYLVLYTRPNVVESKLSKYYILNVPLFFSKVVKQTLAHTFGIKIIIHKTRTLFIYKHTRIHLDEVEDLGNYVELETVFEEGVHENELQEEHHFVRNFLGLDTLQSIKESYSDIMIQMSRKI